MAEKTFGGGGNTSGALKTVFDPVRYVLVSSPVGFYRRVFEPAPGHIQMPWEIPLWLHPRPLEPVAGEERLADGLSKLSFRVDTLYQPTLDYTKRLLEGDNSKKDPYIEIQLVYGPIVEQTVRNRIRSLNSEDFLPRLGRGDAEQAIKTEIEALLRQGQITCEARCSLDSPQIIWPSKDEATGIIPGGEFLKTVQKQHHDFFQDHEGIELKHQEERERQKLEGERQELERKKEREKLRAQELDLQEAADKLTAEKASAMDMFKIDLKQAEDVHVLDKEASTRRLRMTTHDEERRYLEGEAMVLKLEEHRALAEERAKSAGALAAQQIETLEIQNVQGRRLAESAADFRREQELLKILPLLAEKLGKNVQPIQQVSVMQVADQGDGGALPGGPMSQLVQALAVFKQAFGFVNSVGDRHASDQHHHGNGAK
jgi:hypothetical protein